MEIQYRFSKEGTLENIIFEGLNGLEDVSMLKEAVSLLSIENPAKTFARKMRAGEFDTVPEEDIVVEATITNFLSDLWKNDKDSENGLPRLNPLSLLVNSLLLNVELAKKVKVI